MLRAKKKYFLGRRDIRINFYRNCPDSSGDAVLPKPMTIFFPTIQEINLCMQADSWESGLDPKTILHEFGHAMGLVHEHQHPDAPTSESFTEQDCRKSKEDKLSCDSNFLKKNRADKEFVFTPYDRQSVMSYRRQISPGPVSNGDLQTLAELYGGSFRSLSDMELRLQTYDLMIQLAKAGLVKRQRWKCEGPKWVATDTNREKSFPQSRIYIFDSKNEIIPDYEFGRRMSTSEQDNAQVYDLKFPFSLTWQIQIMENLKSIFSICPFVETEFIRVVNFAQVNFCEVGVLGGDPRTTNYLDAAMIDLNANDEKDLF